MANEPDRFAAARAALGEPEQPASSPPPAPADRFAAAKAALASPVSRRRPAVVQGNIDLTKRPVVQNPDGTVSTVRSRSFGLDGQEVLLSTVSDDGRIMSDDETLATYRKTGKHLGMFATPAEATAYAQQLHLDQEKAYVPRVRTPGNDAIGLTSTEVKRRAAAREPIVQEGPDSRPPTTREALAMGAADLMGGLTRGLAMPVAIAADLANLAVEQGGSPIPSARVLDRGMFPLTEAAEVGAKDMVATTRRVLGGVSPEAHVNEYAEAANRVAGELAIPIPELTVASRTLRVTAAGREAAEAALKREASPQNIARIEREITALEGKKGLRALNRQMELENQLDRLRQQAVALADDATPPVASSVVDDAMEGAVRGETGTPAGTVRLYRAEPIDPSVDLPSRDLTSTPDVDAAARAEVKGSWYTKDRGQAVGYKDDIQGLGHDGQIRTVDVSADQVDDYLAAKHPTASNYATDLEKDYFVPPEARTGSVVEPPPAAALGTADELDVQIGQLNDRAAKLFQQADSATDDAARTRLEAEGYALADESDALLAQRDELLVREAAEAQRATRNIGPAGVRAEERATPDVGDFVDEELARRQTVLPPPAELSGAPSIDATRSQAGAAQIRGEGASAPVRNVGPRPAATADAPAAASSSAPPIRPEGFTTSNKNAIVDAERAERGLPPMMTAERQGNQAAWDDAMRVIDRNPQAQDELIGELSQQARALTPAENALLLHRRVDLRNEYEKALRRWKTAFDADDVELAATESARIKTWGDKLADLEDITKATGTESGRSLQARKMMASEDFSLAEMELRATEAKGRTLTPDEHIELIAAQRKITDLQRQIDAREAGRAAQEIEAQTAEALRKVRRASKSKPTSAVADEEAIVGRIQSKFDKGETQSITPLVQQLARKLWERGVRTQAEMIDGLHQILKTIDPAFTRDQTQRAFSGYGDFKSLSAAEIDVGLRDLKGQTQQVLKLEALEARMPLEKTGVERRVPSNVERRLIKQVNELKRKYGVVTTDPATQLKSALQSRKTYYEHRITDLKYEIETRQRIVKTKSPSPRDAELDAMIAEKDGLQAEHDSIFPAREITDEQRLSNAIAAADRSRAQWETRLADAERGVFNRRAPGRTVTSPELEKIRAETAAIREHVEELRDLANPKRTPEERALKSLKTRMANQTLDYQKRLADGDFAARERKVTPLDAEATQLKAERDTAKDAFQAGLEKDRWAKSSVFERAKARAGGVYDLLRTVMSTGEFSFVLRQGKMNFLEALTSPRRMAAVGRSVRDGVRAMRSPTAQRIAELEMISDPMYQQALQHKLYVPEHGARLSRQEEFAMGRYSDSLPVVGAFNRAGESYLKRLRFDNYKIMVRSMTETGTVTAEEGRIIAAHINEQTGRGGLGIAEPAAVALNRVLFSPRYLFSRLQIASGHQLWAGKWAGTGRARKAVAGSYARMLIGGAVYYTSLMTFFNRDGEAELGSDFRSSDAGKIKKGDTRLDPMAGIAQVMTFAQRTNMGETLDGDGEVVPIVGEDVPYGRDEWMGYAARFARSKAHPALGMGVDLVPGIGRRLEQGDTLLKGKNMVGEEATFTSKLTESGPMTYYDIYEALREQDVPDGVAMSMLAWLGEGLQTYGEHTDMLREERALKRAAEAAGK